MQRLSYLILPAALFILFSACNNSNNVIDDEDSDSTSSIDTVANVHANLNENEFGENAVLKPLSWMIGSWEGKNSRGIMYENWTRLSDDVMQGRSFTIVEGDTAFSETMRIQQFETDVYYIVKVSHNEYLISFKLIEKGAKDVTFENLEHDFPNRIFYSLKGDDLYARIEGKGKGDRASIDFHFLRKDNHQ